MYLTECFGASLIGNLNSVYGGCVTFQCIFSVTIVDFEAETDNPFGKF